LAVVDEQHKFGVQQRARLRQGDVEPHYLVMTATPIPRTLAMTLYGDLETSTLRELPPGRQPVHTYVGSEAKRVKWWEFVRRKLREGRQAYVVAPLVNDKQEGVVSSVEALFEKLVSEELDAFRVDLLHGRLSSADKEVAMRKFAAGETQVLVATSLVEVGVDVPNATLMTIENAERFGLAQLHQLRGRVGRGNYPGFVCVFSPSDSPEARQRLEALANTTDGFELAEMDFRLRGPGDLLGTKQHGLPPLRVADLRDDLELLRQARQDARQLLEEDPELQSPHLQQLRERILRRYGATLQLSDVG
jgi:ATP-dependent DNA helicase RecG